MLAQTKQSVTLSLAAGSGGRKVFDVKCDERARQVSFRQTQQLRGRLKKFAIALFPFLVFLMWLARA
jgi:hypothetical protein